MNLKQLLTTTHALLDGAGIRHALIGGLALGAHGVQRFTNDVDWLVHGDDRLQLKRVMLTVGFSLAVETHEVLHFSGLGPVDVLLANRDVSQAMLSGAKLLTDVAIPCLGVEAIIGLKIQAYCNAPKRELRDKADIQALIEANKKIDWAEVKRLAALFDQWEEIRAIRRRAEGK